MKVSARNPLIRRAEACMIDAHANSLIRVKKDVEILAIKTNQEIPIFKGGKIQYKKIAQR